MKLLVAFYVFVGLIVTDEHLYFDVIDRVNVTVADYEISTKNETSNVFQLASVVCGILIVPIGVIGIISNFLTMYVFTRPYMSTSINVLLTGLCLIDSVMLWIGTPSFALIALYDTSDEKLLKIVNLFVVYGYPVAAIAQTASVWCFLVISLETYLAVCRPSRARLVRNPKRAKRALFLIISAAILYNFCRFFEYETIGVEKHLCPLLRKHAFYLRYYVHWLYFFLIFLIPLLALSVFNGLTIRGIKRARLHGIEHGSHQQDQEHEVVYTLVCVVIVFFVCNSLAFILNAIEANQDQKCYLDKTCRLYQGINNDGLTYINTELDDIDDDDDDDPLDCVSPSVFYFLVDINNLLVQINSSVNFVIYCLFNKKFRKYFCNLMPFKCETAHSITADNDEGVQYELQGYVGVAN